MKPFARIEQPLLTHLRARVEQVVEDRLSGSAWTARGCPWLDYWFGYYEQRSPEDVEAAMRKYAGVDGSIDEVTAAVLRRVAAAVDRWRSTGEIDAPPAVIPEAVDAMAGLGPGRPLEAGVRSRMEGATGSSLSDVRVHADAAGAQLAAAQSARAVAVGEHVAFGSRQYRPGSLEGDALLAHELAHTVQQRGARTVDGGSGAALESRADGFAANAVGQLGHVGGGWRGFARTALGATGLRLQRCPDNKDKSKPAPTPSPTPAPTRAPKIGPPWTKPDIKIKMTGTDNGNPTVQTTDVAPDLVYERFELRSDFTDTTSGKTFGALTPVRVLDWALDVPTVRVAVEKTPSIQLDVPKWNLRPAYTPKKGLTQYMPGTTVDVQADTVRKRSIALDDWDKQKDSYKKKPGYWKDQRDQLEKERNASIRGLDVFEIQQLRYNLFDDIIVDEVDKENAKRKRKDPLDPNLAKSIIFRETQMGTSGAFVEDVSANPAGHNVINHWNITQAIDSSSSMYAKYLPLEWPTIAKKHGADNLIHDERAARTELATLEKAPTGANQARRDELRRQFEKAPGKLDTETFIFKDPRFQAAIKEVWASGTPPLNQTYRHWIHMMVLELFDKREHATDWEDATEKYNGINPKYREEVVKRFKQALEALKTKSSIVPRHTGDK